MSDVTQILSQIEAGDPAASEKLLPLVYDQLRKLAASRMAQEKPGQTLQATALVHDAYLRLVNVEKAQHWDSRGHFFGAAAEAMRRILVERARQKTSNKRGGNLNRMCFDEAFQIGEQKPDECIAVSDALEALDAEYPIHAKLVKLRYFAGFSHQEASEILGISRATADRHWAFAKAFLMSALQESAEN